MNKTTSHLKSPWASLSAPSGPPVNWWSEMISYNGLAGDRPRALMWRWRLNHHTSEHATGIYWNLVLCNAWNVTKDEYHEYCVFMQYVKTIVRFERKCSYKAGTEEPDLLSIVAFLTWLRLILGHVSTEGEDLYVSSLNCIAQNKGHSASWRCFWQMMCALERLESCIWLWCWYLSPHSRHLPDVPSRKPHPGTCANTESKVG